MSTFPLPKNPTASFETCPRAFGCPREGGKRRHAACDLYAPNGTPVLAIEEGLVIRSSYLFYKNVYAIDIAHPKGLVRYCEIANDPTLRRNDKVYEGQIIGHVQTIESLNLSMLHLELYTGAGLGPLTNSVAPYYRRPDLINPTSLLKTSKLFYKQAVNLPKELTWLCHKVNSRFEATYNYAYEIPREWVIEVLQKDYPTVEIRLATIAAFNRVTSQVGEKPLEI